MITFDKGSIHNMHKFAICQYIFKQKMLYSTNRYIFTDLGYQCNKYNLLKTWVGQEPCWKPRY